MLLERAYLNRGISDVVTISVIRESILNSESILKCY